MKTLRLCWTYLHRYWSGMLLALVAMLMQTAMDLLGPWPLKVVFDNVLGTRELEEPLRSILGDLTGGRSLAPEGLLNIMIAAMLLFALVDALFTFLGGLLTASVGQRVVYQLRIRIFDHIQRLSLSFHKRGRAGDLSARLTSDIQAIQDMVSSGLNTLLTNALSVLGVLIVVGVVDWHFALLMVGATPLLLFVGSSYRKRIRQATKHLRKIEGQVGATAQEKIGAIQVVQAFANEDEEARQFARQTRQRLDAGLTISWLQSELSPLVDLVGVIALAGIVWLGAREVMSGRVTPGELVLFTLSLGSASRIPELYLTPALSVLHRDRSKKGPSRWYWSIGSRGPHYAWFPTSAVLHLLGLGLKATQSLQDPDVARPTSLVSERSSAMAHDPNERGWHKRTSCSGTPLVQRPMCCLFRTTPAAHRCRHEQTACSAHFQLCSANFQYTGLAPITHASRTQHTYSLGTRVSTPAMYCHQQSRIGNG